MRGGGGGEGGSNFIRRSTAQELVPLSQSRRVGVDGGAGIWERRTCLVHLCVGRGFEKRKMRYSIL